jgi:hypothetical protein
VYDNNNTAIRATTMPAIFKGNTGSWYTQNDMPTGITNDNLLAVCVMVTPTVNDDMAISEKVAINIEPITIAHGNQGSAKVCSDNGKPPAYKEPVITQVI